MHAFLAGFIYAWAGIVYVVRTQRNMRFHIGVACTVVALATWLHLALLEWAILLGCILGVIVAEMLNTVVEAVVDLITDRYHPLAKIAKDVAAGAVLLSAIGSAGIGLLILGPHLWHALFG
jgi:diacylglycerol kinase